MALTQQLTGTKAEFLEFLDEQIRELRKTKKALAEGVTLARRWVDAWQPTDAPEAPSGNGSLSATPVVTGQPWDQDR